MPPQLAQAPDRDQDIAVLAEVAQRLDVLLVATPPSTSPTSQRPVIRLMSVNDDRVRVTRSSSGSRRSSRSSVERLQPQQPHREIVATVSLPRRASSVASSAGVPGQLVGQLARGVAHRGSPLQRPIADAAPGRSGGPTDRVVVPDALAKDRANGAELDRGVDLLLAEAVGALVIEFDAGPGPSAAEGEDRRPRVVADLLDAALAQDAPVAGQPAGASRRGRLPTG